MINLDLSITVRACWFALGIIITIACLSFPANIACKTAADLFQLPQLLPSPHLLQENKRTFLGCMHRYFHHISNAFRKIIPHISSHMKSFLPCWNDGQPLFIQSWKAMFPHTCTAIWLVDICIKSYTYAFICLNSYMSVFLSFYKYEIRKPIVSSAKFKKLQVRSFGMDLLWGRQSSMSLTQDHNCTHCLWLPIYWARGVRPPRLPVKVATWTDQPWGTISASFGAVKLFCPVILE